MSLIFKTPFMIKMLAVGVMPFTTVVAAHDAGSNITQNPAISSVKFSLPTNGELSILGKQASPVQAKYAKLPPALQKNIPTSSAPLSSTTVQKSIASKINFALSSAFFDQPSLIKGFPIPRSGNPHSSTTTTQPPTTTTTQPPTTTTTQPPTTTTTQPPTTTTTQPPTTTTTQPPTNNLFDFSLFPMNVNAAPGTYGNWTVDFNGYGSVTRNIDPVLGDSLNLTPEVSSAPSQTHSALVTTTGSYGNFNATYSYRTISQLRVGSQPNPWEVGWVLFHYTNNTHFYYFIAKPTGWELGKEDPNYPGNQRFLATGSNPTFPIGSTYHVNVQMSGSTISITVNGTPIVKYTDQQNPYLSGTFGLYDEDSSVDYAPLVLN